MLGAVDDEHFSRAFLRFKLESKLFPGGPYRSMDRWRRSRAVRRGPAAAMIS